MATADPALTVLPHCERDPATIDAALQHVAHRRTARRVQHLGPPGRRRHGKRAPDFELIGDKLSADADKDEVDDSFFVLDGDDAHKVRLKIGSVPRRAGTRIKRTLRGKGRKGAPGIVIEEVDDAGSDLDDADDAQDGGTTAPSTAPSSINGDTKNRLTPSTSQDSLVSLELPAFAPLTTPSSRTSRPPALSQPSFSTMTALRTVTSTASSSPPASTFTPDPPSRRLTIDENIAPVTRRDTYSSLHHAASKRGLHLPGRPHFARRHKGAAAAAATASATADALGLDEHVAQALKDAGVLVAEEDRVVVDVLYEHQRGLVVFGLPKFSSNLLFQVDPPQWCDDDLKPSAFTPHTYPLPPYWVWRDSEFMVDMGGDKDEEGWSYALRFRSRFWRGEAYTMRSFVRRRRWVRTRVYRPQHLPLLAAAASEQNALDSMGPPPPPAYDPTDERPIADLHSACAALPVSSAQRAALLTESASPLSYTSNLVPPSNPFLSYRALKLDAASSGALPATERASAHEPRWRDAVRELNWRRASGVVRAHAKIDRQRLELWKLWLGARAAAAGEGGRRGSSEGARGSGAGAAAGARGAVRLEAAEGAGKGAGEAGRKAVSAAEGVAEEKERTEVWDDVGGHGGDKGPDVQDVWDVIEGRLDQILASFDYQYTRILFLELLLSLHPTHDASHRFAGYDVPNGAPQRLERGLADRLAFFDGVKELVAHYGAQGGWLGAKVDALESTAAPSGREKHVEKSRTGKAKGKRRA